MPGSASSFSHDQFSLNQMVAWSGTAGMCCSCRSRIHISGRRHSVCRRRTGCFFQVWQHPACNCQTFPNSTTTMEPVGLFPLRNPASTSGLGSHRDSSSSPSSVPDRTLNKFGRHRLRMFRPQVLPPQITACQRPQLLFLTIVSVPKWHDGSDQPFHIPALSVSEAESDANGSATHSTFIPAERTK